MKLLYCLDSRTSVATLLGTMDILRAVLEEALWFFSFQ